MMYKPWMPKSRPHDCGIPERIRKMPLIVKKAQERGKQDFVTRSDAPALKVKAFLNNRVGLYIHR